MQAKGINSSGLLPGTTLDTLPSPAGRALELFLGRLCGGAHTVAQQYYTNTIAAGHL